MYVCIEQRAREIDSGETETGRQTKKRARERAIRLDYLEA